MDLQTVGEIRRPRGSSAQGRSLWPVPRVQGGPLGVLWLLSVATESDPSPGRRNETKGLSNETEMRRGRPARGSQKKTRLSQSKTLYLGPRGSPFKKRPCGPVLKERRTKSPAPGAPREWVSASLVPAAACHFAQAQIKNGKFSILFVAPGF